MSTRPRAFWTDAERAQLRALAPLGLKACVSDLTRHTKRSIRDEGRRLGVCFGGLPGDRDGVRWRGKLKVPPHAHPIIRRIYEEANRQLVTLTEIADRAGTDRHALYVAAHHADPRLSDVQAWLNVLGLDLKVGWVQATESERAAA